MTLDKDQAAAALADIGASQSRATSLYSYSRAAPFIFLVGVMWFVADLTIQFAPLSEPLGNLVWPIVSAVSIPAFIVLMLMQARNNARPRGRSTMWKSLGLWLIIFAFVAGTFQIFYPFNGRQTSSFIGMFIGAVYAALGLWMGWRLMAIGLALALLSFAGFLWVHQYYAAYMGVVGGGGLMLSAFWLRKV